MGKRCGSERWVVAVPEVGLSIVAGMIVAVDVATKRRPYDSTPFRSHARSMYNAENELDLR